MWYMILRGRWSAFTNIDKQLLKWIPDLADLPSKLRPVGDWMSKWGAKKFYPRRIKCVGKYGTIMWTLGAFGCSYTATAIIRCIYRCKKGKGYLG